MVNDSYSRTPEGYFQQINRRLVSLERRLPAVPEIPPPYVPIPVSGTTAERDARFGAPPSTDANRVALANQKPIWYNTDLGWQEGYFAVTGLSGLTARGLVAGTASGWYPTTVGPKITLVPSAAQSIGPGNTFTNFAPPGTGISHRDGGTAWFTYSSGAITVVKGARYAINIRTTHQGGTGMHELIVVRNNTVNDANTLSWMARELGTSAWSQAGLNVRDYGIVAGSDYRIKGVQGTASMGMGGDGTNRFSGEFTIEYTGPDLVTE